MKIDDVIIESEGNFVGDFAQPNIGGATVKPMQVGDTVSYFGQTATIQAQSPDRKHSRIEITKGTGGVVQTVLTSDLKRVHRGMAEEFRPTTGQAMGIRNQIAQKMNPDNNKFVWKRPNQIMGSHTENELRALKFRYSAKHNAWGGTQQMWGRLEGTLKEFAPSGAGRGGDNYFKILASAWYGGAYNTGSLQRGIKSKQDVERMLQQGIVCPDGVTRKFGIDYNSTDDGVVISSDDYYEHSDHGKKPGTMIDVRTGKPWGPYDYMEFSDADLSESLTEFSPIKPPTAGAFGGNKDYGQPTSSRYLGNNKFVLGTTNNYVLTATVDKWGLEWDEDDEIWFLDSPGAVYIADATEGEIELPAPQEQRNQIHDLVSDYLNARNSAELQRVAAYYGHSADGEMATSEGWGGALVGAIGGGMIGGPVGAAVGGAAGYALGGGDDSPEEAYELGQQMARDGYSEEDNPYEEGWTGPSDAMQAWHDGWTDARGEYEDDEDDEDEPLQAPPIKQLSAPVAVPTKTVAPPKTSGPVDFSKRGFTGYKKPGDMEEGIRVPAQQILGTKNRAKSAYYPTNVKPKVPKLDRPLTDQELVRLAQLAGIKDK